MQAEKPSFYSLHLNPFDNKSRYHDDSFNSYENITQRAVLFMHARGSVGTAANMQLTLVTNVLVKARRVF